MSRPVPEMQKAINPACFRFGWVADPAPEIFLDKDRLAKLKASMLEQEILDLKGQVKLAEMYHNLIKKQFRIG